MGIWFHCGWECSSLYKTFLEEVNYLMEENNGAHVFIIADQKNRTQEEERSQTNDRSIDQ